VQVCNKYSPKVKASDSICVLLGYLYISVIKSDFRLLFIIRCNVVVVQCSEDLQSRRKLAGKGRDQAFLYL
jgi:hypothetical protein